MDARAQGSVTAVLEQLVLRVAVQRVPVASELGGAKGTGDVDCTAAKINLQI